MNEIAKLNSLKEKLENIANAIKSLKADVQEVSDCIENKRNLSEDTSNRIINTLKNVNELNGSFKKLYDELSFEEKLSDDLTEVERLISKAIAEYELNDKLSAYSTFLKLYSDDSKIMELLSIRKKELKALLDNYSSDNEEKLVPYGRFVEAIKETDPSKLVSYVAELTPAFGNDLIGAALFSKSIYISDKEDVVVESKEEEQHVDTTLVEQEPVTTEETIIEEPVVSSSESEVSEPEDIKSEESNDDNEPQEDKTSIAETDEISVPVIDLKTLFPDDYSKSYDETAEKKRLGSKVFVSELRQRNVPSNVAVMSAVDSLGAVTPEIIALSTSAPFSLISDSIHYLYNKGYLRSYSITKIGSYYCASPRGIKSLQAKDARAFMKLKGNPNAFETENYSETLGSVLARLALTKMISAIYSKGNTDFLAYRNILQNEAFYTVLRNKETHARMVFGGAFISSPNELIDVLAEAREIVDDRDLFYIIAGANDELAKNYAGEFIKVLKLKENAVYYYSLIEGALRHYSDDEVVTFSVFDNSEEKEEIKDQTVSETHEETLAPAEAPVTGSNEEKNNEVEVVIENHTGETVTQEAVEETKTDTIRVINPDEERHSNVIQMINNGMTYCATTYLRSLSEGSERIKKEYEQLAYAVNAPWMKCSYSSSKVYELYVVGESVFSDYMLAAASLRNVFMNHTSYDYQMKALQDYLKESECITANPSFMNAIYKIALFKDEVHKGMDCYADYRVKDQVATNKRLEKLETEAQTLYDLYINGQVKNHKGVRRFIETWKRIFSADGDLAASLKTIIDKDTVMISEVKDTISEKFINDDCSVEYSNVDMNKLNAFIDDNWNSTFGTTSGSQYKTSNLMSDLRHNLTNAIEKVLKVICDWIGIVDATSSNSDEGFERYWESKKDISTELISALESINTATLSPSEERAGRIILRDTIAEIINRIDGSYSEKDHKYYYIDFLRGNYVWLDDDYFPDMHGRFVDLPELSLPNRIIAHSKSKLMSFEEKLDDIFDKRGDDYGSAKLIIGYLKDTQPDIDLPKYDIETAVDYAKEEAKLKLAGFTENLEFARVCGHIEENKENIKEKISGIVHDCYQYAEETHNYSFLKSVMDSYTRKIREDAKIRGKALTDELVKLKSNKTLSDAKEELILQIESMIDEQKYLVAEDLLSRINDDELMDRYEVSQPDYLKKFIDEYDRNYKDVNDLSKRMSGMVSTRIHNKDEKGARRLLDNWIISGTNNGVSKIGRLLDALGFEYIDVKEQPKINGKIENYAVEVNIPIGTRPNYKHPIAAFGSIAAESGFRVVCLFGKYDTDRLIQEFKNISGSKNTLVLLDCALSLNERRRLARKSKSEMGDKVFAVLDRVLLMFLVNNYNIQFINQIMMSAMIPFTYCQPYVWDSSKVMPPEIFVGRKNELEKIESPQGVNIVYGGRQLGKSALLKMAKLNVDYSENNRAVYIEIKGLDYKKAATKIGHELFDAGILTEDISTEDWDELARSIKHRLNDTKNDKIPYLLLLLDEADTFIESCESVSFHPLDTLKDIQSVGAERFKFVIAGLHNIVRFKRDAALSNNSVLTHLSSITIKPFSTLEAQQLLVEPLHYLGLRFFSDRDISLILANTNYFPGLIQLYCAKLVDAMRKNDYAGYNQLDTPAYTVTSNHIKKVLADAEFTNQVWEKFEITLKLDEDNMYYILALLVAYLYHQDSLAANSTGVTPEDVISAAKELSIRKVAIQTVAVIEGYMQELKELNVFRQTVDEQYLFSKYSFFQMMGTIDEVENKLMEYMED